jgi:hypothetical protein
MTQLYQFMCGMLIAAFVTFALYFAIPKIERVEKVEQQAGEKSYE